jgi:ectoine hydroxylase-related dioxygenase (phytanoyl-CoA dioxygenase family)
MSASSDFEVVPTAAQVDFFREHGYLRIERITTDAELAWLSEIYDRLFREERGIFPGGYFDLARPYDADGPALLPQLLFPEQKHPELRETAFFRNGRRIAAVLLGATEDELSSWGHMILKRAERGPETPWHQDEAYWEPSKTYRACGLWLALDDATRANGCLHFIPGSHRRPVQPHRHLHDDPSVHALEVEPGVDTSGGVAVPIPAGGATLHHCRTLHYAGPNRTPRDRRAYTMEFQLPPVPASEFAPRPWLVSGKEAWAKRKDLRR